VSTSMSQARARALRPATVTRPGLTIVPKASARMPRIPFVLLVVIVLGVGLVGLLLLNTSLERGAYAAGALRTRAASLDQRQQELAMKVAALQRPLRVAQQAERLGMVPNSAPVFLEVPSGKVLGAAGAGAGAKVDLSAMSANPGHGRAKVEALAAGSHNTVTSGAIVVAKPKRTSGRN
jgi:hypothetical protein